MTAFLAFRRACGALLFALALAAPARATTRSDADAMWELATSWQGTPASWVVGVDPCGSATCSYGTDSPNCTWAGIACYEDRVVAISTPGVGLKGQIPDALGSLSSLAMVDLSGNELGGSIPDAAVSGLTSLQALALRASHLGGSVPDALSELHGLEYLDLGSNGLMGSLPESLGDLSRLGVLLLDGNALSGKLPDDWQLLTKATRVDLSGNQLSGTLPGSWWRMGTLMQLSLAENALSGTFPSSWASLRSAELIDLTSNCGICGRLPNFGASEVVILTGGTSIGYRCSNRNCESSSGFNFGLAGQVAIAVVIAVGVLSIFCWRRAVLFRRDEIAHGRRGSFLVVARRVVSPTRAPDDHPDNAWRVRARHVRHADGSLSDSDPNEDDFPPGTGQGAAAARAERRRVRREERAIRRLAVAGPPPVVVLQPDGTSVCTAVPVSLSGADGQEATNKDAKLADGDEAAAPDGAASVLAPDAAPHLSRPSATPSSPPSLSASSARSAFSPPRGGEGWAPLGSGLAPAHPVALADPAREARPPEGAAPAPVSIEMQEAGEPREGARAGPAAAIRADGAGDPPAAPDGSGGPGSSGWGRAPDAAAAAAAAAAVPPERRRSRWLPLQRGAAEPSPPSSSRPSPSGASTASLEPPARRSSSRLIPVTPHILQYPYVGNVSFSAYRPIVPGMLVSPSTRTRVRGARRSRSRRDRPAEVPFYDLELDYSGGNQDVVARLTRDVPAPSPPTQTALEVAMRPSSRRSAADPTPGEAPAPAGRPADAPREAPAAPIPSPVATPGEPAETAEIEPADEAAPPAAPGRGAP